MKPIKENSGYPKKVVVVGSHYVGKTTLCKELSEHFSQRGFKVEMLGEVARECPHLVNEDATLKAQSWILGEQKRMEKELAEKSGVHILLLDRGLIDNFAYWLRAARNNNASEDSIKEKERKVFKYSRQYNAILFIQPFDGKKIEDDGFRSIDIEWRKEMHDRVDNVIKRFKDSYNAHVFNLMGSKKEISEEAITILENQLHLR